MRKAMSLQQGDDSNEPGEVAYDDPRVRNAIADEVERRGATRRKRPSTRPSRPQSSIFVRWPPRVSTPSPS